MKTLLKKFVLRYFAALLIGFLLLVSLVTTEWMIDAIRDNIAKINIITPPYTERQNDSIAAFNDEQFLVREYDGRIGVFVLGDTQPFRIIDVYISYLPEGDRSRLREGISVGGRGELDRLLEDLRS